MLYKLDNGKSVNIPDADLHKLETGLEIDRDEAILMWLEDEGYLDNDEQIELDKIGKQNRINLGAKAEKPKERKPREKKTDPEKEKIIADIAVFIENFAENVKITNISKIIEFDFGENHYKIDLIRQRKSKNE